MAEPLNNNTPAVSSRIADRRSGPPVGIPSPGAALWRRIWAKRNAARCRARRFFFCQEAAKKMPSQAFDVDLNLRVYPFLCCEHTDSVIKQDKAIISYLYALGFSLPYLKFSLYHFRKWMCAGYR